MPAFIIELLNDLSPWSLGHALPLQEISSKSVHNFFSYPMDRQTDKQTDRQTYRSENITSFFAEVMKILMIIMIIVIASLRRNAQTNGH